MSVETYSHFRYEIALGAEYPMPKPLIDYYDQEQFTLQQYLHTLCKANIGALGKRGKEWSFGDDAPESVKMYKYPEFVELLNYAERMGLIVPADPQGEFTPYKLSESYWEKFDSFAS